MSEVTSVRAAIRALLHNSSVVIFLSYIDILAAWVGFLATRRGSNRNANILLTTTGDGNIGDQAMFEAYLENVRGRIIAIAPTDTAFRIPEEHSDRVRLVVLSGLLYDRGITHYRAVFEFGRLMRGANTFSVTGADIMDGGYNRRLSESSWSLALAASFLRIRTQVLGFSWKESADRSVQRLARRASRMHVRLNVRDPLSLHRLSLIGVRDLVPAADMVFLMGRSAPIYDPNGIIEKWTSEGNRIALINSSGLIANAFDPTSDYCRVLEFLIASGFKIVLLPHVIRPDNDDLEQCKRVAAHFSRKDVCLVDRLLAPRQVKALSAHADIVITGRMHLSILGLSGGTASVVLATQGKVAGLLEMFGRPEWCIEPELGMADKIVDVLSPIVHGNAVDDQIVERHPDIRKLAAANFQMWRGSDGEFQVP